MRGVDEGCDEGVVWVQDGEGRERRRGVGDGDNCVFGYVVEFVAVAGAGGVGYAGAVAFVAGRC